MSPTFLRLFQLSICTIFLFSCSIQKRVHRPGYYVEWPTISLNSKKINKSDTVIKRVTKFKFSKDETMENTVTIINESPKQNTASDLIVSTQEDLAAVLNQKQEIKHIKTQKCDEIITHDGEVIQAQVLEIGTEEIKYKKCESPDGPIYSIYNNDVFVIIYKDGTRDVITNSKDIKKENLEVKMPLKKKVGMSVTGFILGLIGYLIGYYLSILGGLLLCILGIIFSSIAIHKIRKYPEQFGKKALAVLGLIFSLIGFILIALFLIL